MHSRARCVRDSVRRCLAAYAKVMMMAKKIGERLGTGFIYLPRRRAVSEPAFTSMKESGSAAIGCQRSATCEAWTGQAKCFCRHSLFAGGHRPDARVATMFRRADADRHDDVFRPRRLQEEVRCALRAGIEARGFRWSGHKPSKMKNDGPEGPAGTSPHQCACQQ